MASGTEYGFLTYFCFYVCCVRAQVYKLNKGFVMMYTSALLPTFSLYACLYVAGSKLQ
jgi:hypothetical protein